MGIKQRIEEDLLGIHRKRDLSTEVGTVINSYYDQAIVGNQNILIDVVYLDGDGSLRGKSTAVPLLKQGGVAQSLPPTGSLAVILNIGGSEENKVCLGYMESQTTSKYITDDKTPKTPPRVLFK